jgi:hypothetical protein
MGKKIGILAGALAAFIAALVVTVVLVLNVAGSPTDGNVTETILDPGPTPTTADPASDTVVIPHTQATVT